MINIYDVSGRSVESTHVDSEKRPYKISLGFATIKREFYDNGLMKRAYYDTVKILAQNHSHK